MRIPDWPVTDLHFEAAGAGNPPVVLVHAGIADRRMWDREMAALRERHRVVRYDVRGFGRSPDPAGDYFDHDDLLAVMTAAGVERAVVVGASNGGRIALDTAVSAPDRVAGLVLVGASLPGTPLPPAMQRAFAAEEEALREGDLARAREINLRSWVDGVGRHGPVSHQVRDTVGAWLDTLLPRQAAQMRVGAGQAQEIAPPLVDRLRGIAVPALVVVGQHDQPHVRAAAQRLAFDIPDSRLVVVEDAAHLVSVEQPERFAAELDAFLDRLGAGG